MIAVSASRPSVGKGAQITRGAVVMICAVIVSCFALTPKMALAQTESYRTFNLSADPNFQNYPSIVRNFALRHRPAAPNDFCILGYTADDNSKMAWVLWRQGMKVILWEGQNESLDLSRRIIDLKTDVVPTDNDLHGSSYLVTKAWLQNLTQSCKDYGTQVHVDKGPTAP